MPEKKKKKKKKKKQKMPTRQYKVEQKKGIHGTPTHFFYLYHTTHFLRLFSHPTLLFYINTLHILSKEIVHYKASTLLYYLLF